MLQLSAGPVSLPGDKDNGHHCMLNLFEASGSECLAFMLQFCFAQLRKFTDKTADMSQSLTLQGIVSVINKPVEE